MAPLLLAPTVALLGVSACQVCAWVTLEGLELCIACLDVREWSRVNRAFCDVLHRGRPLPLRPGRPAWEEEVAAEGPDAGPQSPGSLVPRRHPAAEPLGAVA